MMMMNYEQVQRKTRAAVSTMSQLNWFMISNELRAGSVAGSGSSVALSSSAAAVVVSIAEQQPSAAAGTATGTCTGTAPGTSSLFPMLMRNIVSTQSAAARSNRASRASIGPSTQAPPWPRRTDRSNEHDDKSNAETTTSKTKQRATLARTNNLHVDDRHCGGAAAPSRRCGRPKRPSERVNTADEPDATPRDAAPNPAAAAAAGILGGRGEAAHQHDADAAAVPIRRNGPQRSTDRPTDLQDVNKRGSSGGRRSRSRRGRYTVVTISAHPASGHAATLHRTSCSAGRRLLSASSRRRPRSISTLFIATS